MTVDALTVKHHGIFSLDDKKKYVVDKILNGRKVKILYRVLIRSMCSITLFMYIRHKFKKISFYFITVETAGLNQAHEFKEKNN